MILFFLFQLENCTWEGTVWRERWISRRLSVLEDEEDIFDVMSKLLASKSSKHALSDPIIAPWVLSLTARMDTQLNFDLAEESVHRSQNTRDKCLNEGPRLGVTLAEQGRDTRKPLEKSRPRPATREFTTAQSHVWLKKITGHRWNMPVSCGDPGRRHGPGPALLFLDDV